MQDGGYTVSLHCYSEGVDYLVCTGVLFDCFVVLGWTVNGMEDVLDKQHLRCLSTEAPKIY